MTKIKKYEQFIGEGVSATYLPSYEDCLEMCSKEDAAFYESKSVIDGYNISMFNYRMAQYSDFLQPLPNRIEVRGYEMRGITFVFNKDGSLFKRFILLEKFFNINQVPESMYSVVKDYKIKFVNNKEDGSIASFIQLPNGKICGKSKMSFNSEQAVGITSIYKNNPDVNQFVNWCMENNICPIFEYVAPHNRIVLRYPKEELILLRLRDNRTGKHISLKEHLDKLGSIKIAPFRDDYSDLNHLIELIGKEVDSEGVIVHAEDSMGRDAFFKLKTPWYASLHGLLTDDIYKENILIDYILADKIDDILGQIPEEEFEARDRIASLVDIVKKAIAEKIHDMEKLYKVFVKMGSKKEFALKYRRHKDFPAVMQMVKGDDLKSLSKEQIEDIYSSVDFYETSLNACSPHELAKVWVRENTKRLLLARNWIKKMRPDFLLRWLHHRDEAENEEDN